MQIGGIKEMPVEGLPEEGINVSLPGKAGLTNYKLQGSKRKPRLIFQISTYIYIIC